MTGTLSQPRSRISASRLGFWAAVLTVFLTIVSFGMAITTLPRSGPSCTYETCVTYPYTDIAAYFPRDYLWMFPATLLQLPFIVLMACVHVYADDERKPFSLAALIFASIGAAIIFIDYFIQLTVVQPSILRGETDGLSLISQYNPHGVYIALEAAGFSLMNVAFFALAAVFTGRSRIVRALRWLGIAAFVLTVVSLIGFYAAYGNDIEYRYEIAVISIAWTAQIIIGALLSVLFRRSTRPGFQEAAHT